MHRIVMLLIMGSTVWGWISLPRIELAFGAFKLPLTFTIALCGSTFWGVATIYLIDLLQSHRERNSHFLKVFYQRLHEDLMGMVAMGFVTVGFIHAAGIAYSFSSTDIAFAGLSMFVTAILTVARTSVPRGTLRFSRRMKALLISLNLIMLTTALLVLLRIASKTYLAPAAAWMQITILAAGFCSYVAAKQVRYFVESKRVAYSPTIKRMLFDLRGSKHGMYDMAAELSDRFNRDMRAASSKRAAHIRRGSRKHK